MIAYSLQPVNSNLAEKAEKQAFSQRQERDKRGDKGEKPGLRAGTTPAAPPPGRRAPTPPSRAGQETLQIPKATLLAFSSASLLPGRFVVVCRLRGFPLYHTEPSVQAPTDTPSTRQGGDDATPDPPPLYSTAAASGVASYYLDGSIRCPSGPARKASHEFDSLDVMASRTKRTKRRNVWCCVGDEDGEGGHGRTDWFEDGRGPPPVAM